MSEEEVNRSDEASADASAAASAPGNADSEASTATADSASNADSASAAREAEQEIADDPLEGAMNAISDLEDQLKRAQASLYNTEQEYNNYVKRTKTEFQRHRDNGVLKVVEALLPVLDDVELARSHDDLDGGYKLGDRVIRPARVAVVSPE